MRRTALLLVAVLSAVSLTACGGSKGDVVAIWFDQTAAAAATQGGPDPVPSRTWALAWWAADRAVSASPDDDAAVATAVHDVLLALVPGRREQLDRALGDVDDAAGHREAAAVLAERAGDGLTAAQLNRPVTLPAPGPGVYRATGEPPAQGGQGDARPFLLRSTGEVAVTPPPALAGAAYARDLDEVRRLGERTSTERTPAQTELATVLQQRVGDLPFTLGARRYTRWQQIVTENIDARVWAGVHVRSADVAGADLGRRVAELDLARLAA